MQRDKKLLQLALHDSKLVHVTSVANGKSCNCICPHCGHALMAKNKGRIKVAHFAHINMDDCPWGVETAVHLLCKEIFYETQTLFIPNYDYFFSGFNLTKTILWYNKELKFDKVELEKRIPIGDDFIIADAVGYINEKQIIIEFANTHFINEEKRKKIKKLNFPCLEFSISLGSQDKATLKEQLLTNGLQAKWIVNPKGYDQAKKELEKLTRRRDEAILKRAMAIEEKRLKEKKLQQEYDIKRGIRRKELEEEKRIQIAEASTKGNLILSCPIPVEIHNQYKNWLIKCHPIVYRLIRSVKISRVFDDWPGTVDIFIDNRREVIVPKNYDNLSPEKKQECLKKWDAIQMYLDLRNKKQINFCKSCKFYRGACREFIICTYSNEKPLNDIFSLNDDYVDPV